MKPTPATPLLLLALLLALLPPCTACRCFPPTVLRSYYTASTPNFIRGRVTKVREPASRFGKRRIKLRIQANYKGCARGRKVTVRAFTSSASCGISLTKGVSYVLPLRAGRRPTITSCDFIRPYVNLTPEERDFLESRLVCCGKSCACASGNPPVSCFRQPCSPLETCDAGARCVDNYCGGCRAEWFDKMGKPVCWEPLVY